MEVYDEYIALNQYTTTMLNQAANLEIKLGVLKSLSWGALDSLPTIKARTFRMAYLALESALEDVRLGVQVC